MKKSNQTLCFQVFVDYLPVRSVVKKHAIGAAGLGSNPGSVKLVRCRHRCDASSELCCPGAKARRWASPLVARFGCFDHVSIMRDRFEFDFYTC